MLCGALGVSADVKFVASVGRARGENCLFTRPKYLMFENDYVYIYSNIRNFFIVSLYGTTSLLDF